MKIDMIESFPATPIIKVRWPGLKCNLYMKRDDLLPFSFGGNKARIAYEFYADMDAKGKDCMIGYGNARSNLNRALAALNSVRGGICHIISPADDDGRRLVTNNSLLVNACGAIFHECTKQNVAMSVASVMEECIESGLKPYYIYGDEYGNGNEATPVRAYVKVYQEILRQEIEFGIHFDSIVLATGTGMTQAGLIAGQCLYGGKAAIYGISIARDAKREREILQKYLYVYGDGLGKNFKNVEINLVDDYLFGGYGQYTSELLNISKKMYLMNGVSLDLTYTSKAFYGLQDMLKKDSLGENILFIHTGGTPLFFDNIEKIFAEE